MPTPTSKKPPPPSRPPSYYICFRKYAFDEIRKKHPQVSLYGKICAPIVRRMWDELNEQQKAKYMKKAQMFWILYTCQKKKYQKKYGKVPKRFHRKRLVNRNMAL